MEAVSVAVVLKAVSPAITHLTVFVFAGKRTEKSFLEIVSLLICGGIPQIGKYEFVYWGAGYTISGKSLPVLDVNLPYELCKSAIVHCLADN